MTNTTKELIQELEHTCSEMSQKDWNSLGFKRAYEDGFMDCGKWLIGEIEQLQSRNAELERERDELAARVERFIELRDHLPNVRQWVIEFEKLVHKSSQHSLSEHDVEVAKRAFEEGASWATVYCLDETTEEAADRYVQREYNGKDGE